MSTRKTTRMLWLQPASVEIEVNVNAMTVKISAPVFG
jgi:hypothetical protein